MSYREQMHGLALTLGELVRDGGQVPPEHLDLALTAHATVVQTITRIHHGVTGIGVTQPATVAGLERDPVGVLGRLLDEHPKEAPIALSDAVAQAPDHLVAQRWKHAARHAALAMDEWDGAELASLPEGQAAWAELTDVAALTDAVVTLDRDLAESLRSAGRTELARRFESASTSGLATAAAAARSLATSGPIDPHHLLGAHPDLVRRPASRVVAVRSAAHLPAALNRLGHLLNLATDVSPEHVKLIARALATASHHSASTLERVGPENRRLVAALREQLAALVAVNGAPRRAAALSPSNPLPLAQGREIYEQLAAAGRRAQPLTDHVAHLVARACADATLALGDAVDRQVFQDRWLAPTAGSDRTLNWERLRRAGAMPVVVDATRQAVGAAKTVAAIEPAGPARRAWPAPRAVLTEMSSARTRSPAQTARQATPGGRSRG